MAHIAKRWRVERVEDVSPEADVTDFDELGEQAQEALPRVIDGEAVAGVPGVSELLTSDVINYTQYYRVECGG